MSVPTVPIRAENTADALEAAAMPRARSVHTDPDVIAATGPITLPQSIATAPVGSKSPAQWAYERLILYIRAFEEQLDAEHEVAMGFAGGDLGVMRIEGIGHFDPDIVTFYGTDADGAKAQLVQHVSQLNVMLRALPKAEPDAAPRRIGFRLVAALDDEAAAEAGAGTGPDDAAPTP